MNVSDMFTDEDNETPAKVIKQFVENAPIIQTPRRSLRKLLNDSDSDFEYFSFRRGKRRAVEGKYLKTPLEVPTVEFVSQEAKQNLDKSPELPLMRRKRKANESRKPKNPINIDKFAAEVDKHTVEVSLSEDVPKHEEKVEEPEPFAPIKVAGRRRAVNLDENPESIGLRLTRPFFLNDFAAAIETNAKQMNDVTLSETVINSIQSLNETSKVHGSDTQVREEQVTEVQTQEVKEGQVTESQTQEVKEGQATELQTTENLTGKSLSSKTAENLQSEVIFNEGSLSFTEKLPSNNDLPHGYVRMEAFFSNSESSDISEDFIAGTGTLLLSYRGSETPNMKVTPRKSLISSGKRSASSTQSSQHSKKMRAEELNDSDDSEESVKENNKNKRFGVRKISSPNLTRFNNIAKSESFGENEEISEMPISRRSNLNSTKNASINVPGSNSISDKDGIGKASESEAITTRKSLVRPSTLEPILNIPTEDKIDLEKSSDEEVEEPTKDKAFVRLSKRKSILEISKSKITSDKNDLEKSDETGVFARTRGRVSNQNSILVTPKLRVRGENNYLKETQDEAGASTKINSTSRTTTRGSRTRTPTSELKNDKSEIEHNSDEAGASAKINSTSRATTRESRTKTPTSKLRNDKSGIEHDSDEAGASTKINSTNRASTRGSRTKTPTSELKNDESGIEHDSDAAGASTKINSTSRATTRGSRTKTPTSKLKNDKSEIEHDSDAKDGAPVRRSSRISSQHAQFDTPKLNFIQSSVSKAKKTRVSRARNIEASFNKQEERLEEFAVEKSPSRNKLVSSKRKLSRESSVLKSVVENEIIIGDDPEKLKKYTEEDNANETELANQIISRSINKSARNNSMNLSARTIINISTQKLNVLERLSRSEDLDADKNSVTILEKFNLESGNEEKTPIKSPSTSAKKTPEKSPTFDITETPKRYNSSNFSSSRSRSSSSKQVSKLILNDTVVFESEVPTVAPNGPQSTNEVSSPINKLTATKWTPSKGRRISEILEIPNADEETTTKKLDIQVRLNPKEASKDRPSTSQRQKSLVEYFGTSPSKKVSSKKEELEKSSKLKMAKRDSTKNKKLIVGKSLKVTEKKYKIEKFASKACVKANIQRFVHQKPLPEVVDVIHKAAEKFVQQVIHDMSNSEEEVLSEKMFINYVISIGLFKDKLEWTQWIREVAPLELRRQLIPCARAGNAVY